MIIKHIHSSLKTLNIYNQTDWMREVERKTKEKNGNSFVICMLAQITWNSFSFVFLFNDFVGCGWWQVWKRKWLLNQDWWQTLRQKRSIKKTALLASLLRLPIHDWLSLSKIHTFLLFTCFFYWCIPIKIIILCRHKSK